MPTCSVIVPWCDRYDLAIAIARNNAVFGPRGDVEVVVVNAGGQAAMLTSIVTLAGVSNVRCIDLPGATFNRSLCINIGTLAAKGEYLLLIDADILVTTDFLDEGFSRLSEGQRFLSMHRIFESVPEPETYGIDWSFLAEVVRTKELRTRDGRRAVLIGRNTPTTRPGHGQLLLKRNDLVRIGGMNAQMQGWGFEDSDLQLRLQFGLGLECQEFGEITHMTHQGGARDFAQWRRNSDQAYANYRKGDFQGTYEADAAYWRERIRELPLG